MITMEIIIEGKPIPRARARIGKWGGYDPQAKEMNACKLILKKQALELTHKLPLVSEGPIRLNMTFFIPIPKSWSKKKKIEAEGMPCISKPDLDNYVKFILDAMNGIIYNDDAQVCEISTKKIYNLEGKTIISIE